MNEWYFYQERGKTVGPVNVDEIKGRIKDGRIKVFDLIYKDGDSSWRMALEHSALRAEFKNSTLSGFKDRPWVCLQRKSKDSSEFVTTGPFTKEEIGEAIQSGKVSYSDFAWKDGFAEWKRIGSLEEFNPRVRRETLPPVPKVPEESSTDLIRNVVEMQRMNFSAFDFPLPPEADSDFAPPHLNRPVKSSTNTAITSKISSKTQPAFDDEKTVRINTTPSISENFSFSAEETNVVAPMKTVVMQAPEPRAPMTVREDTPTPKPAPKPKGKTKTKGRSRGSGSEIRIHEDSDAKVRKKPRLLIDWGLVGVLFLMLAGSVLIVSRFMLRKSITPDAVPSVAEQMPPTPKPVTQFSPPEPEPAPPPEPVPAPQPVVREREKPQPPKAPESLFLSAQVVSGGQPRLIVRSDGTAQFPVYLQIVGLTGQVSDGGSYYRFLRLKPNGNWMKPIDFSAPKMPQGKFIVRAETGELKKEVKFAWGVNDAKSKQNLAHQRKTWAYAIWKERLALFRLSLALERQVTQALSSKRFTGRGWEPLVALKRSSGGNYLMFDDWWELHNIVKEAKSGVNTSLLARAQKERERLASFSIWK